MCRNLARVVGSEIAMLTKSDDRGHGYLRRHTACIMFSVDSLSEMIGRVRPEAISKVSTSLYPRFLKVKVFHI